MNDNDELGALIEAFFEKVSHQRGRVLNLMAEASVTATQIMALNFVRDHPGATPSSLAAAINISLSSSSQMIERLVRLGLARRIEDPVDRRGRIIEATPKARDFLKRLKVVRSAEFASGAAGLSEPTRRALADALSRALKELAPAPGDGAA